MPPDKKRKVKKVTYNWDEILEFERQAKEKTDQISKKKEQEQRTEEAAAEDLKNALVEDTEKIVEEIEIKQEVVFDPNE